MKQKLLILSSGTRDGGGSGFEKLVQASRTDILEAEIVGVVCNHEHGGVREKADRLGIKFILMKGPWTAENYQEIVADTGAKWVALSGWLKPVCGLNPRTTFNIHPGPLPRFGGKGMYGHHVHEAVHAAYVKGDINASAVSMHFVTDMGEDGQEYDGGPTFFVAWVPLLESDTPKTIAQAVNGVEHIWQPLITNAVILGDIGWDGKDPNSLYGFEEVLVERKAV